MNIYCALRAFGAMAAVGAGVNAFAEDSYQQVAERLDLDGSLVAYVDFDGDGQEIGERLSSIYQKLSEVDPNVPPMPLDFAAVFETLGFGSMKAMGMSSKELEDGLVRNRTVTLLEGEPKGLLNLYGLEPISFRAAELAPAGTTMALSGQLDLEALRDTLIDTVTLLMGPMGQGFAQQALSQPIPGAEVTINDVILSLSGRFDVVLKQDYANLQQPDLAFWISIDGAGPLLNQLEALAANAPQTIEIVDTEDGRTADLSGLLEGAPFGLFLRQEAETDDLVVYSSPEWLAALGGGELLANSDAFQKVASRLPKEAAFFTYSAGFEVGAIVEALKQEPEMAKYAPVLEEAIDLVLGDFLEPNASAMFRTGDALITEQYAGYSYKQALMAAPVGGVALAAAVAVPAFKQFQAKASPEEAAKAQVRANLDTIAQLAHVVMLEERLDEVSYADIQESPVGVEIESVMGESYEHIVVTAETTEISVELPNGEVVTVELGEW